MAALAEVLLSVPAWVYNWMFLWVNDEAWQCCKANQNHIPVHSNSAFFMIIIPRQVQSAINNKHFVKFIFFEHKSKDNKIIIPSDIFHDMQLDSSRPIYVNLPVSQWLQDSRANFLFSLNWCWCHKADKHWNNKYVCHRVTFSESGLPKVVLQAQGYQSTQSMKFKEHFR